VIDHIDEHNLVADAKSGDKHSFGVLLEKYIPRAYAVALLILRNSADAQDAVQAGSVSAYRRLNQLHDHRAFGRWFVRIVANESTDIRRRQRDETPLDDVPIEQLGKEVEEPETGLDLEAAIDLLPEFHRTVVRLYYSGLTTGEVAIAVGRPSGTVRRVLSRSYMLLRRTLRPDYMD
jgi:RNA polymerase sigma-70 factor (ECF subfamily)